TIPSASSREAAHFLAMLVLILVTLRPLFDLSGGDFPIYLQAQAFASFRLPIHVPEGASQLPTMLATAGGRYYSVFPPGSALLLVPFYWLGHGIDEITGYGFGKQRIGGWAEGNGAILAVHLSSVVFFAGILLSLRSLSQALNAAPGVHIRAGWLLLLAAPFLYLGGHLETHYPSTLFVVLTYAAVFARAPSASWIAIAGVAAGTAFLVRPVNVLLCAPIGVYVLTRGTKRIQAAILFAAPVAVALLIGSLLNTAMFGNPLKTSYQTSLDFGPSGKQLRAISGITGGFTTPLAEGLFGMTFGAVSELQRSERGRERRMVLPTPWTPWERVRGFVLLMPVLLFAFPGFRQLWRSGRRGEVVCMAATLLVPLFVYAKWFYWYANPHTPLASRYLSEGYPACCLAIAVYGDRASGFGDRALRFATSWSVMAHLLVVVATYVVFLFGVSILDAPAWQVASFLLGSSLAGMWLSTPSQRRAGRIGIDPEGFDNDTW
ncbi:MAG: hypothetical protein ACREA0_08870, partial [bacterium]